MSSCFHPTQVIFAGNISSVAAVVPQWSLHRGRQKVPQKSCDRITRFNHEHDYNTLYIYICMYVFNINILACIDIYSYVFWDMYVSYKQMMPALKHRCASLHADPQQPQVCLLALLAFEYFPSHLSFWPCPSRRAFARCDARSRNVSLFFFAELKPEKGLYQMHTWKFMVGRLL